MGRKRLAFADQNYLWQLLRRKRRQNVGRKKNAERILKAVNSIRVTVVVYKHSAALFSIGKNVNI